jgi:hypothetical protein
LVCGLAYYSESVTDKFTGVYLRLTNNTDLAVYSLAQLHVKIKLAIIILITKIHLFIFHSKAARGSVVVETLCYKLEGLGYDSR